MATPNEDRALDALLKDAREAGCRAGLHPAQELGDATLTCLAVLVAKLEVVATQRFATEDDPSDDRIGQRLREARERLEALGERRRRSSTYVALVCVAAALALALGGSWTAQKWISAGIGAGLATMFLPEAAARLRIALARRRVCRLDEALARRAARRLRRTLWVEQQSAVMGAQYEYARALARAAANAMGGATHGTH